jgi:hypothetical protein
MPESPSTPPPPEQPPTAIVEQKLSQPNPGRQQLWLRELLSRSFPDQEWIVKDLIHRGDQVVLAGPPKIGKSMLATQLAAQVAFGAGSFIDEQFAITSGGRKVLFFSLEMNEPMLAERLGKAYSKEEDRVIDAKLAFIFRVRDPNSYDELSSFDVIDFETFSESRAKKAGRAHLSDEGVVIQQIIEVEKPDLVIFDTLIRIHSLDENNNVAMSQLLKHVRQICSYPEDQTQGTDRTDVKPNRRKVAHVLVHHTRKESANIVGPMNRDANAVRGAGAIHAEADLVLTLSEWGKKGALMVSFSARRVETPDEIFIKMDPKKLQFNLIDKPLGVREAKQRKLAEELWNVFQGVLSDSAGISMHEIVERIQGNGFSELTVENYRKTYRGKLSSVLHETTDHEDNKTRRFKLRANIDRTRFFGLLGASPFMPEKNTEE